MNFILSLILVLVFVSQAHAGLFDQVLDAANVVQQQAAQSSQSSQVEQPQAVTQPEQDAKAQGVQKASADFVKLEKGVYGIPFKADLATVLKWCEENKVNIRNLTKEQVEENAKSMLGRIKKSRFDYENRKFYVSEAEKDLLDMVADPQMDAMERIVASQAKQLLETLKNPAGNYGGKSYLLNNDFLNGIELQVDGVQKVCTDKRITDSIFSLTVSPSDQSNNLLNQSLQTIKIVFFKDESGKLWSYAAIATFYHDRPDQLQKQFKTLADILSQKYGAPSLIEDAGYLFGEYPYVLARADWGSGKIIEWKKNVFIRAGVDWPINYADKSSLWLTEEFKVFYFESDFVGKVAALQTKTLEDFKSASANEDANKAKLMQQNF